jgi:hypothetical protein
MPGDCIENIFLLMRRPNVAALMSMMRPTQGMTRTHIHLVFNSEGLCSCISLKPVCNMIDYFSKAYRTSEQLGVIFGFNVESTPGLVISKVDEEVSTPITQDRLVEEGKICGIIKVTHGLIDLPGLQVPIVLVEGLVFVAGHDCNGLRSFWTRATHGRLDFQQRDRNSSGFC